MAPTAESVLAEIERLSNAGLPLRDFARACLEEMRAVVPFDLGAPCVLAPEAQYERFVGCWPEWAGRELNGRVFSTVDTGADMIRHRPEGALYRASQWPGFGPTIAAKYGVTRLWSAPFLFDGEYFGSITLGRSDTSGRFTSDELDFARAAAAKIAFAMRREVDQQNVKLSLDRAAALSQLAMMVNAGERLEAFYAAAMPVLRTVLPIDFALLKLRTEDPNTLRVVASDLPDLFPAGEENVTPSDRYGMISALSFDVETAKMPGPVPARLIGRGFQRALLAPLVREGDTLGLFVLARRADYAFSQAERSFIELFAALVTQAVVTNNRLEESAAEAQEQGVIAHLAEAITTASTVDGIASAVQAAFADIIPDSFAAYSYIEGEDLITPVPGRRKRLRFSSGPNMAMAIRRGQHVPPRGETGAPIETAKKIGLDKLGAISYTAAIAGGAPIGILLVSSRKEGYEFGERELRLFRLAARMLGPAMENVRKVETAVAEAEEERLIADVARVAAFATKPLELSASLQAPFAKMLPGALVGFGCIERKAEGDEVVYPSYRFGEEVRFPLANALAEAAERGHAFVRVSGEGWTAPLEAKAEIRMGTGPIALAASYTGGVATGILGVRAGNRDESFTTRQVELFKMLANIIGTAMANVRATEQLARENDLHQLVLTSLSEAVILFDHNLQTAFSNEGGRLLMRAAADNAPKKKPRSRSVLTEDAGLQTRDSAEPFAGDRGRVSLTMGGEPRWFDYENIPLTHRDFKLLLVASDVTAEVLRANDGQRHRDELEQSNRLAALGELVSGVAHELNNPLTAILGFSEVLLSRPLDEQSKEHAKRASFGPKDGDSEGRGRNRAGGRSALVEDLAIIHREAERARDIVRNLLAVARPNVAQRAAFDVADLIAHVAKLRSGEWARLGIDAKIDCSGVTLPGWADAQQVTQVLLNLVVNAEHALLDIGAPPPTDDSIRKPRKRRLSITASTITAAAAAADDPEAHSAIRGRDSQVSGRGGSGLVITVRDNGHGMDEATRRRIFEPFFTTRQGSGTGLGLSLSYSIASSHEGTLTAESRPGRGSTFTLTLPLAAHAQSLVLSPESLVSPEASPEARPIPLVKSRTALTKRRALSTQGSTKDQGLRTKDSPRPAPRRRVLVIDDEPNIGKLCRRLITALGHDCETAASASAALDYIAAASGSHSGGAGTSAVQLPGDEDSRGPQHGFDLIVCDYRLGTETADDVIEGIRKIAPELLSRVVIATGATTDAGVQNICERYDLQLIAKPYGSAEIARVLAA